MISNRIFRLRINTGLIFWDFPVTQMVKNLPAMQENWIQSIRQEDPPEKEMAWRIPWTEEPGGLQSMGSQRLRQDCATNIYSGIQFTHSKKAYPKYLMFRELRIEKTL